LRERRIRRSVPLGLLACSILVFVLAARVVVPNLPRVLHLCPYPDDPRSYAREGCGTGAMSNEYGNRLRFEGSSQGCVDWRS